MNNGTVDHSLKASCRLRLGIFINCEIIEFGIDIIEQLFPEHVDIDITGTHDRGSIAIINQRKQKMLERRILMAALIGILERAMKSFFKTGRE